MKKGLLVTLKDPVIASVDAATAGHPETLTFLPGAMLLGAVASRCYDEFDGRGQAFDLFHSGVLRFGDALPVDGEGRLGFPVPASLHRRKGEPIDMRAAVNLARTDLDGQRKQYRNEAIELGGEEVRISRVAALKTAISPVDRRAKDGQLFGVEALAAEQRFWSEISSDDNALLMALQDALPDDSVLRLGRSRSAEFGRAEVRWTDPPPVPGTVQPVPLPSEKSLLLWALSDMALDPEGDSLPSMLGLGDVEIDPSRSFMRLRRVWPYNGHWAARGHERLVVQRGSVISITDAKMSPIPVGVLYRGLCQEIGCGRLLAAPAIIDGNGFSPERTARAPALDAVRRTKSEATPIFDLIAARHDRETDAGKRVLEAERILQNLGRCYVVAADLAGASVAEIGPGPTQWSAVRVALSGQSPEDALFGENGIAREGDADWGTATGIDENFREWLRVKWNESGDDREQLVLVAKGASEAVAGFRETGEWRVCV